MIIKETIQFWASVVYCLESWPKSSISKYTEMHPLTLKLHSAILTCFHLPSYIYRENDVNVCVSTLERILVKFYTSMERLSFRNLPIKSTNYKQ